VFKVGEVAMSLTNHLSEPLNLTWDVVKLSQDGVGGTYPLLDKRECREWEYCFGAEGRMLVLGTT
jgi:hypothetical protein